MVSPMALSETPQRKRRGKNVVCPVCSKEFYAFPSQLARGSGVYCSHTCASQAKVKPRIEPKTKQCSGCGKVKQIDAFSKNKSQTSGRHPRCRDCHSEYSKGTQQYRRLKMYGLSDNEYGAMLRKQKGRCAICRVKFGEVEPHIDHCHATGKVRGILCRSCNHGLGNFKDKVKNMQAGIAYLEASRGA